MVNMKMDFKDETGAVYPLALFLIPVLIVLAGLIIDIGMGVYQHTKLTSAVDAAAIATLDAYDREKWEEDEIIEIDPSRARGLAASYLSRNMPNATIKLIQVDDTEVTVEAEATAQLFIMPMFGRHDMTLEAMARASLDDD